MSITLTHTETSLLEGLKAHDEQAYSYLYDNYSKALFGVIYQIIPQQNVAEDILQEVFVKIWQNIASYDGSKGRLFTWLLNITRNLAIDKTRSKEFNNRAKTVRIEENVYKETNTVTSKIDDVGLRKIINQLPEDNRKLLELAYFQDTQEEIAKILNIPLGTVKTRIRTTILQLRKTMGVKI